MISDSQSSGLSSLKGSAGKSISAWDPQSSGLSSLKGDAKPGGLRLTPDGFAFVALQLASWFLF